MSKRLKFGVVGVGSMGRNHVRVLMDTAGAEVVGIADNSQATLDSVSSQYRVPTYTDYKKLIAEQKIDCLVVACPTTLHRDVCLEAFKRGIHVLVEKPIAFTVEEGEEMVQSAKTAGVIFGVGHIERFNPAVIELKKRLTAGALGRVFMMHSKRQSPLPRRIVDVGVGMDLATHELDMMHYLNDSEVAHLSAEVSQVGQMKTREDIIFGLLRFRNGVLGILDVNWVTPTTVREITITGEKGMFLVNYHTQDLYFFENPAAALFNITDWSAEKNFTVDAGNMTRFQIVRREPLRSELEAFISAVLEGRDAPVTGVDGLRALDLALRIVSEGQHSNFGLNT